LTTSSLLISYLGNHNLIQSIIVLDNHYLSSSNLGQSFAHLALATQTRIYFEYSEHAYIHYYKSWSFLLGKLVKKDPKVTLVNLTKVPFWTNWFQQCLFWLMAFFPNYILSFWLAEWMTNWLIIWLVDSESLDWVNFISKLKSFFNLLFKKLIGK
jgi:hypothetical protein